MNEMFSKLLIMFPWDELCDLLWEPLLSVHPVPGWEGAKQLANLSPPYWPEGSARKNGSYSGGLCNEMTPCCLVCSSFVLNIAEKNEVLLEQEEWEGEYL